MPFLQFMIMCSVFTGLMHQVAASVGEDVDLSKDHKCGLVWLHNSYRNKVANGENKGLPKAKDMMKMAWDEKIAKEAKDWLHTQCYNKDNLTCINSDPKREGSIKDSAPGFTIQRAIDQIFDLWRRSEFNYSETVQTVKMNSSRLDVIHQMQLLSPKSTRLGCGLEKIGLTYVLVCYYDPPLEMSDQPVYQKGEPCSACPAEANCSTKFRALCTTDKNETGCFPVDGVLNLKPSFCMLMLVLTVSLHRLIED